MLPEEIGIGGELVDDFFDETGLRIGQGDELLSRDAEVGEFLRSNGPDDDGFGRFREFHSIFRGLGRFLLHVGLCGADGNFLEHGIFGYSNPSCHIMRKESKNPPYGMAGANFGSIFCL